MNYYWTVIKTDGMTRCKIMGAESKKALQIKLRKACEGTRWKLVSVRYLYTVRDMGDEIIIEERI